MTDPTFLSETSQPRLGKIFSDELRRYAWCAALEPFYSRLYATEKLICEKLDGKQDFSEAFWNLCFPRLRSGEFWHYTDLQNLANIIKSGEIWLHPVKKRMGETELVEFASTFGYRGFFDIDERGERLIDKYSEDLFFLSLTSDEGPSELSNYGEVRLRFRVEPVRERAELRHMKYAIERDHPLHVLNGLAQQRFNSRKFLPLGVSRMIAFLLDPFYSWEQEVRLLIKRFEESTDLIMRKSGPYDVLALPIGVSNERVLIDLKCIEADTAESLEQVKSLLAESQFNYVSIGLQP